jgi:hypothetical protein
VTTSDERADVPCPECQGAGWSRSASGRCTPCRGAGVTHPAAGRDGRVIAHAGPRADCAWCATAKVTS